MCDQPFIQTKASSCWFTHSFNRFREKKFVLTWRRTLLVKEQLVVTLLLTFVAANIFLRNCLVFHSFPMETIGCPHQGKAAPLFVCPAQRQGIFLLEGGGNFWHNFKLWCAIGQWSITVVFVTQPLKNWYSQPRKIWWMPGLQVVWRQEDKEGSKCGLTVISFGSWVTRASHLQGTSLIKI